MTKAVETTKTLEHYLALVEELGALKVEESFDMGLRRLQWAHTWGKTIREYEDGEGITDLVTRLSVDVGRDKRSLFRYIALFDRFPELQKAIDSGGKNISIQRLIGETPSEKESKELCDHSCARHCK